MSYEYGTGLGQDFGTAVKQAWGYITGQRMLPTEPVTKWLTRLNVYAPLLYLGVRPEEIEYLLENPNELAEAFEQANQAQIAAQGTEAKIEAYGSAAGGVITGVLKAAGFGAGATGLSAVGVGGAGLAFSAMAQMLTSAITRSQDCIESTTVSIGLEGRLKDDLKWMRPYLHDGMAETKDGLVTAFGVARDGGNKEIKTGAHLAQFRVDGLTPSEKKRRNYCVYFMNEWLWRNACDKSRAELNRIAPKLQCMAASIRAQPNEKARRELGGLYYASLTAMMEVHYRLQRNVIGWKRANRPGRYALLTRGVRVVPGQPAPEPELLTCSKDANCPTRAAPNKAVCRAGYCIDCTPIRAVQGWTHQCPSANRTRDYVAIVKDNLLAIPNRLSGVFVAAGDIEKSYPPFRAAPYWALWQDTHNIRLLVERLQDRIAQTIGIKGKRYTWYYPSNIPGSVPTLAALPLVIARTLMVPTPTTAAPERREPTAAERAAEQAAREAAAERLTVAQRRQMELRVVQGAAGKRRIAATALLGGAVLVVGGIVLYKILTKEEEVEG